MIEENNLQSESEKWFLDMIQKSLSINDLRLAFMFHCLMFDQKNGTSFYFNLQPKNRPRPAHWQYDFPVFVKTKKQRDTVLTDWAIIENGNSSLKG